MSQYYSMKVQVSGHNPQMATAIKAAATKEWPFEDWEEKKDDEKELVSMAADFLCAGEGDDDFAKRLTVAIWRANEAYCEVVVEATYMEELPFEEYQFDEKDYKRLIGRKRRSRKRA